MKLYRKYRQWRGYGFARKNALILAIRYLNLDTEISMSRTKAALQQAEEAKQRRSTDAERVTLRSVSQPSTWRPTMTEQEKREHEQYVIEHDLPF